ncbi:FAD/NAD(P)-binding protein [Roseovarius salinarum]|uniref:FAD/NAD(P)-binding protein n=1 Tax=Roseovarius salinarum TaxID=1981892 RepID=UPI000C333735|nr:FAD/NAD(P)-binding protein [Roseovarius salinarum]
MKPSDVNPAFSPSADSPGRHHVVVGDGLSGAAFAATVPLDPGDRLTIVGPEAAHPGRGLAYQDHAADAPWRHAFLLNQPADVVDPEFPAWVRENWTEIRATMTGRRPDWLRVAEPRASRGEVESLFLPRAIFGDYWCGRVERALALQTATGVTVTRRAIRATGIEAAGNAFIVTLADGTALQADSVDLAPGGWRPQRFPGEAWPHAVGPLYGNEAAVAETARAGGRIAVIGSGSAMLDVLRLLQAVVPEDRIDMVAVAPSGRPQPAYETGPLPPTPAPAICGPYATAHAFLAAFDADMANAAARGPGAEMALRNRYLDLFDRVPLNQLIVNDHEARRAGTRLERRVTRGTPDSLHDLARLRATGRVRLHAAGLRSLSPGPAGCRLHIETASGACATIDAALAVSCAGRGTPPAFDPLTDALIRRGWLVTCPVSGGIEVGPGFEAAHARLRYASPAVTVIGGDVEAYPLYNGIRLRHLIAAANAAVHGTREHSA